MSVNTVRPVESCLLCFQARERSPGDKAELIQLDQGRVTWVAKTPDVPLSRSWQWIRKDDMKKDAQLYLMRWAPTATEALAWMVNWRAWAGVVKTVEVLARAARGRAKRTIGFERTDEIMMDVWMEWGGRVGKRFGDFFFCDERRG